MKIENIEKHIPKYVLSAESIDHNGLTLYRIQALRDFSDVKAGDTGGFVQSYDNLSQSGNCWVYHDAKVMGQAKIHENARISHHSIVCDYAQVYGDAEVNEHGHVGHCSRLFDHAMVTDHAILAGNAEVCGEACILGDATVIGQAEMCGAALIQSTVDYITVGPLHDEAANRFFYITAYVDNKIGVRVTGLLHDRIEMEGKRGDGFHAYDPNDFYVLAHEAYCHDIPLLRSILKAHELILSYFDFNQAFPFDKNANFFYIDGLNCMRINGDAYFNVPRKVKLSSKGMMWGGFDVEAEELAINTLLMITDEATARRFAPEFQETFLAAIPFNGANIPFALIQEWLLHVGAIQHE
jgi:NDP-sugar pyrophosphorylase family protein